MGLREEIAAKRSEIVVDSYPMSIGELMNLYKDEELDVHPEFQRFEQAVIASDDALDMQADDTDLILDESKKQQDKENEQETIVLDEIDTIGRISDKKSLIEYAKNKYDQDLNDRSSVKTLQNQVVDLIKRFGVV